MRTPLQGVKHTLGTTTRDRAAVRSTATKAPVGLWLARGSQRLGMSNVGAAAAFARGIFNLTRTGIAAELTAASEQRLPPVGGRCRIATKRGVQGSEAGAVVSGMRPPLQSVKHTLEPQPETGRRCAFILNTTCHFMDKKPGRGTRSGALLPGFSAFSVNFRPEIVTKLCQ